MNAPKVGMCGGWILDPSERAKDGSHTGKDGRSGKEGGTPARQPAKTPEPELSFRGIYFRYYRGTRSDPCDHPVEY